MYFIKNTKYGFSFDQDATIKAYQSLGLMFENSEFRDFCLPIVKERLEIHEMNLGIDFEKPWEEIVMEHYYQVEYLFVGEIFDSSKVIFDEKIGINVFHEVNFGAGYFKTVKLLNLTIIIPKN